AALALPFTSTPFDDDDDNDADAIDRRPVAGHHSSHNPECAAASSGLRVLHLDCGRDWRGGQAQVLMLMQGLARRGVDNLLLAPPGPLFDRARDRGYACERWSPRGDWDLVSLARAGLHLEARRPDVVHCHDARSHAVGVPAARLARVRAVVVSLRERARLGLDARVHLLGHRADAQSLLSQCTVCALASLEEGLGTSLIEAQALGVPVVATAVGGVPEVIDDGRNGRLVPRGDPAAMAAALLEALSSPDF